MSQIKYLDLTGLETYHNRLRSGVLKFTDTENRSVTYKPGDTLDLSKGVYYATTSKTATKVSNPLTITTLDGDIVWNGSGKATIDLATNWVIVKGDADNSAVLKGEYQGYSNKAISQVSMALGAASTAGLKGWYYSKITFGTNPVITLSDKQPTVAFGYLVGGNWSSGTPNIKAGDKISIVNNSKYDYCGEVKSVSGNTITLKSALPFDSLDTSLISVNNPDDWTIYLPDNESAGIIDFGGGALAEGVNTKATNIGAHAEGIQTHAYGQYSHSEGFRTQSAYASHAEGRETEASGLMSHAEGRNTVASGDVSHAEGYGVTIDGVLYKNIASGKASHAEGRGTEATGDNSHAEGYLSKASATLAHAEGHTTTASGTSSHSEGRETLSSGAAAHAEGTNTIASGQNSHAEGQYTEAYGNSAHAEGRGVTIDSVLYKTLASGNYSHAEGRGSVASGEISHAEGYRTVASGAQSHAEGYETTSSGTRSHAGGRGSVADGNTSFAHGSYVKTTNANEVAFGTYNDSKEGTLFSIGNGTSDEDRSNIFEIRNSVDDNIDINFPDDPNISHLRIGGTSIINFESAVSEANCLIRNRGDFDVISNGNIDINTKNEIMLQAANDFDYVDHSHINLTPGYIDIYTYDESDDFTSSATITLDANDIILKPDNRFGHVYINKHKASNIVATNASIMALHPTPQRNVIYYTTNDNSLIYPQEMISDEYGEYFGNAIHRVDNNTYVGGKGVMILNTNDNTIHDEWFKNLTKLTSIILPDNIEHIGTNAFLGCTNLKSITIGANAGTNEGCTPFSGCMGEITIKSTKLATDYTTNTAEETIGKQLLSGSNFSKVIIDTPQVGDCAFYGCTDLNEVLISKGTKIGNSVFSRSSIKSCTIETGVEFVRTTGKGSSSIFYNCSELTHVKLGDITSIVGAMFLNCKSLSSIILPDTLNTIGSRAFENTAISEIIIPKNVTSIAEKAFLNCSISKVYLRPERVVTLTNVNAFNAADITNRITEFYVPLGYSNTYANATNWSSYVDSQDMLVPFYDTIFNDTDIIDSVNIVRINDHSLLGDGNIDLNDICDYQEQIDSLKERIAYLENIIEQIVITK